MRKAIVLVVIVSIVFPFISLSPAKASDPTVPQDLMCERLRVPLGPEFGIDPDNPQYDFNVQRMDMVDNVSSSFYFQVRLDANWVDPFGIQYHKGMTVPSIMHKRGSNSCYVLYGLSAYKYTLLDAKGGTIGLDQIVSYNLTPDYRIRESQRFTTDGHDMLIQVLPGQRYYQPWFEYLQKLGYDIEWYAIFSQVMDVPDYGVVSLPPIPPPARG